MPSIPDLAYTGLLIMFFTMLSGFLAGEFIDSTNVATIFFIMVIMVAYSTTGYLCSIIASLVGVMGVNYFFTYPYSAFNFSITGYPITFASMLFASIFTSALTSRIKKQSIEAMHREKQSEALYEITRSLYYLSELQEIATVTVEYLHRFFSCGVAVWLGAPSESMMFCHGNCEKLSIGDAMISYNRMQELGLENDIVPKTIYLPIIVERQIFGVIGLVNEPTVHEEERVVFDGSFLRLIVSQIAVSMEYRRLERARQQAALDAETEKMRSNLLRAISHDLRTPLTGIYGASTAILQQGEQIDPVQRNSLLTDIGENAQWLIRMVENLLAVTRIEKTSVNFTKTPEAAEEIIGAAVSKLRNRFPNANFEVRVPDELLMVPMDPILIEQVIINLGENAARYAQSSLPIRFSVKKLNDVALFEVIDHGNGIPAERIKRIFDGKSVKESNQADSYRGMGIGLPICKTIITTHGGVIGVVNQAEGGCRFYFNLPLNEERD